MKIQTDTLMDLVKTPLVVAAGADLRPADPWGTPLSGLCLLLADHAPADRGLDPWRGRCGAEPGHSRRARGDRSLRRRGRLAERGDCRQHDAGKQCRDHSRHPRLPRDPAPSSGCSTDLASRLLRIPAADHDARHCWASCRDCLWWCAAAFPRDWAAPGLASFVTKPFLFGVPGMIWLWGRHRRADGAAVEADAVRLPDLCNRFERERGPDGGRAGRPDPRQPVRLFGHVCSHRGLLHHRLFRLVVFQCGCAIHAGIDHCRRSGGHAALGRQGRLTPARWPGQFC